MLEKRVHYITFQAAGLFRNVKSFGRYPLAGPTDNPAWHLCLVAIRQYPQSRLKVRVGTQSLGRKLRRIIKLPLPGCPWISRGFTRNMFARHNLRESCWCAVCPASCVWHWAQTRFARNHLQRVAVLLSRAFPQVFLSGPCSNAATSHPSGLCVGGSGHG